MTDLAKPIDVAMQQVEAEMALWEPTRSEDDSLVDHYARCLFEIEADEVGAEARYQHIMDSVKAAYEAKMNELARRRKALEWKYGPEVQNVVADKLSHGKQKHVKTPWGSVGFRKVAGKSRLIVENEQAAVEVARDKLPDAVIQAAPRLDKLITLQAIERGQVQLPGVRIERTPDYQTFYFRSSKLTELESEEPKPQLER